MKRSGLAVLAVAAFAAGLGVAMADPAGLAELKRGFERPPDDCRIMMRWWWFGPAATKAEVEREMRQMKSGGIGGFELAFEYPQEVDDPTRGIRNYPFLSPEFLDVLRFTGEKAKELGLRMDVTLGSGWPIGDAQIPITEAAAKLRVTRRPPRLSTAEQLVAQVKAPSGDLYFVSTPTLQMVARWALGAEGFVLDPYNRAAVERHLRVVAEPMLAALQTALPRAVFSDSLEVMNSDWTPDFFQKFQKRRGYDLKPLLPALVEDIGPQTRAVRRDWGKTLTELADENFLGVIEAWSKAHHILFRSQNYGTPPVNLSSNAIVDLPEGEEGYYWRQFSDARWASSASHLYGRPVTSTETWTWLHSPVFRATPVDMKAEADLHFIQGINQLVGHGWPYSPAVAGEPGWRFYAAGNFNAHNPWWIVMPDVARYLQRVSYLLRQGSPANDVGAYVPTDDIYAGFHLDGVDVGQDEPRGYAGRNAANAPQEVHVSVSEAMDEHLGSSLLSHLLEAGYNFDYIDDEAISRVGIPYRVLILPRVERIPLATLRRLQSFAQQGGILIALDRPPTLAPGLREAETDGPPIRTLSSRLFGRSDSPGIVANEGELAALLHARLPPDLVAAPQIGFIHRALGAADFYFVVNTSNYPVQTAGSFRCRRPNLEAWNPVTGEVTVLRAIGSAVRLDLAPYESRVFVFSDQPDGLARNSGASTPQEIDLSGNWEVRFGSSPPVHLSVLRSWAEDRATRCYSGTAVYERQVTLAANILGRRQAVLDFGHATPENLIPEEMGFSGMRAKIDAPVRDAAKVYVNGRLCGAVWCPPYSIDVTPFLHAGDNDLRVMVANTAINEMVPDPYPNYRALNARYGDRFPAPETYMSREINILSPLPSGLVGRVRLILR